MQNADGLFMRHRRGDGGDSGDKGFLDGGCYCIFMEENTGHRWCQRQLLQPKINSWECVKKRGLLYTWCFTCQVMVRFKQIKKDALANKALPEETNVLLFLHLYLGPKIWTQVSSNISPRKEVPILRAGHTGAGFSWTPISLHKCLDNFQSNKIQQVFPTTTELRESFGVRS